MRYIDYIPREAVLSETKMALIGACFTMEYAIESAALFNPSIVLHPDQSHLKKGCLRFIMSLRATGEGHISSIVFRSGVLDRRTGFSLIVPAILSRDRKSTWTGLRKGISLIRSFTKWEGVMRPPPCPWPITGSFHL